jgi:hypothetical protein
MAKQVISIETEEPRFSNKTVWTLHTDGGEVYVFESWQDTPGVRFVRRGSGEDAREDFTTNNYTLPRNVRRVANSLFGGVREACGADAEPRKAEPVGWHKD